MTTAGAPIGTGEASPLRVATGGEASLNSEALAAARPPVPIHGAMNALGWPKSAALAVLRRACRAPLLRSIGLTLDSRSMTRASFRRVAATPILKITP